MKKRRTQCIAMLRQNNHLYYEFSNAGIYECNINEQAEAQLKLCSKSVRRQCSST